MAKTESVRAITDEMRRAAGAETDPARLYGWADRLDQALVAARGGWRKEHAR